MNNELKNITALGTGGRIFASVETDKQVRMVAMGDYDIVRYRFNQIACLVAGMGLLQSHVGDPVAQPSTGQWPVAAPAGLFELAAQGPGSAADQIGYLAYRGHWPQGAFTHPGLPSFAQRFSDTLGRLFYDPLKYPMARVGSYAENDAAHLTRAAIAVAKGAGYRVHDEEALLQFLDMLTAARCILFFHEVIDHA